MYKAWVGNVAEVNSKMRKAPPSTTEITLNSNILHQKTNKDLRQQANQQIIQKQITSAINSIKIYKIH